MPNSTFDQTQTKQLAQQNTFSTTEVGITHLNTPGYIRLTDAGDIQIMADDGLGIIINYKNRSITLMADTFKIMTTDHEGFGWNTNFFNPAATVYSQPALNPATGTNVKNVFAGTENYYSSSTTGTQNTVPLPTASSTTPTQTSQDLNIPGGVAPTTSTGVVNTLRTPPTSTNTKTPNG